MQELIKVFHYLLDLFKKSSSKFNDECLLLKEKLTFTQQFSSKILFKITLILNLRYLLLNSYFCLELTNLFPRSYFLGIPAMRPGQRHLYYVSSLLPRVGSSLQPAVCITCTETLEGTQADNRKIHSRHYNIWSDNTDIHDHYEMQTENTPNADEGQTKGKPAKKEKSAVNDPPSEYRKSVQQTAGMGGYQIIRTWIYFFRSYLFMRKISSFALRVASHSL